MLSATDPLPGTFRRVLVAGCSGSGKTTLARAVGTALGVAPVEIDALFHGPGWIPRPTFETEVRSLVGTSTWITEWQYDVVRDLLADRADLVVWLDLPRAAVLRQVVGRTLSRRLRRAELWNGNVEPPLRTLVSDPEHVIRWAWSSHQPSRQRVLDLHQRRPDLPVVRLRSRREVRAWVAGPLRAVVPGGRGVAPGGGPEPAT